MHLPASSKKASSHKLSNIQQKSNNLNRYYTKKIKYRIRRGINNPIWSDSYDFLYSKKRIIVIISAVIIFALYDKIVSTYDYYIVDSILIKFKSGFVSRFLILIVWAASIIFLIKKAIIEKHRLLLEATAFLVLAGAIYSYYRFCKTSDYIFFGPTFLYFGPEVYQSIKYLDFIVLFFIVALYLFWIHDGKHLLSNYFKRKKKIKPIHKGFLTDTPLGTFYQEKDLFNWRSNAIELINRIKLTTANQAFAVGISSEWGAGKTSFFHLLKEEVKKCNNIKDCKDHFIIVDFNPWFSNEPKKIVEDFFNAFKNPLKDYDSNLTNEILSYASKLQSATKDAFSKIINAGVSLYYSDSDITKKYQDVNSIIKRLDKKILIFIDDLDRLDKDELVEVLRIIRNTSSFYNCFFFIAYDRHYVDSAVKKLNEYNSGKYLDKIVQFELHLPIYDHKLLNEIFYEKLSASLGNTSSKISLLKTLPINSYKYTYAKRTNLFDENLSFDINNYLRNIRDINRYVNLFMFEYSALGNTINFRDLLLLILIKYRYNFVWQVLSNSSQRMLLLKMNSGTLTLKNKDDIENHLKVITTNINRSLQENILNQLLSTNGENNDRVRKIDEEALMTAMQELNSDLFDENDKLYLLLNALFFESREQENASNSITHDSNYHLYFFPNATLVNEYSLAEFSKDLRDESMSDVVFMNKILARVGNNETAKVLGLFHKLSTSYGSLNQFRKVILTYCEVLLQKTSWPAEEVLEVITRIEEASGPGIDDNSKNQLYRNLIDYYKSEFSRSCFLSYLLSQILLQYCRHELKDISPAPFKFFKDKAEVQDEVIKLLEFWVERDIKSAFVADTYSLYNLLYSCIDKIEEGSRKIILINAAFPLFRKAALKYPLEYLSTLIRSKYSDPNFEPTYVFEPYLSQVWDDYKGKKGLNGFEVFLKEIYTEVGDTIEYQRVLRFYAAVIAKMPNSDDVDSRAEIYFDSYGEWFRNPDSHPINSMIKERFQREIDTIIDRIVVPIQPANASFKVVEDPSALNLKSVRKKRKKRR